MEAPINIVVESPDADAAELVGRAIGQGLRDGYGFTNVVVAHIQHDTPGLRAWRATDVEEKQETLLDAMKAQNPQLFEVPVTVISRGNPNSAEVHLESLPKASEWFGSLEDHGSVLPIGGIGLTGVTAEDVIDVECHTVEEVKEA